MTGNSWAYNSARVSAKDENYEILSEDQIELTLEWIWKKQPKNQSWDWILKKQKSNFDDKDDKKTEKNEDSN